MGTKKSFKRRWSNADLKVLAESGLDNMTSKQRYRFARSMGRTERSVIDRYRQLTKPVETKVVEVPRTQTITKSEYSRFMDAILDKATTAVINKSNESITIYF
tara:strand:- start:4441 stop:4749 length:309 start_codon:yes stop_codon:yes gene_type:complete